MTQEELLQLMHAALPPSEKLDICRHPTGAEPYRAGKSYSKTTDHIYVRFGEGAGATAFLISITPVRDIP